MHAVQHPTSEPAPPHILAELADRGITASVDGTELRLTGPAGSLTPEIKAAIKEHTAALLVAVTGFRPLDRSIIRDVARKHTMEQIRERLAHARQMAAEPTASPLRAQVVRDWIAILQAKEQGIRLAQRAHDDADSDTGDQEV